MGWCSQGSIFWVVDVIVNPKPQVVAFYLGLGFRMIWHFSKAFGIARDTAFKSV